MYYFFNIALKTWYNFRLIFAILLTEGVGIIVAMSTLTKHCVSLIFEKYKYLIQLYTKISDHFYMLFSSNLLYFCH